MDREVALMAGAERNSGMSKLRRYRNDVGALRREVKKSVRIGFATRQPTQKLRGPIR
jgi:hypothetical protein